MEYKTTNQLDAYDIIQAFKKIKDPENLAILYDRYIQLIGSSRGLPLESKPKDVLADMGAIYRRTYRRN